MTIAPDPTTNVAVELANLRGEINTGLENIKGTLNVLVERTTRTDEDLKRLRADTEKDINDLRTAVEGLKSRRWPLGAVGALTGVAGAGAGIAALFLR